MGQFSEVNSFPYQKFPQITYNSNSLLKNRSTNHFLCRSIFHLPFFRLQVLFFSSPSSSLLDYPIKKAFWKLKSLALWLTWKPKWKKKIWETNTQQTTTIITIMKTTKHWMCMQTNNKYSWERITIYRIFFSAK